MLGPTEPVKTILAFAYACEPHRGSEPTAGWTWARMLASLFDTTVITRANNRTAIEAELSGIPERDQLHFVYVDLPRWTTFWKRGQRGIRLYYFLWQLAVLKAGRRLNRQRNFDFVWHLTLANAWLGSVGSLVGPPFIYGPVGGCARVPWRLLPSLGLRGIVTEALRITVQFGGRMLNPFARLAWRNAEIIFVQNREAREWFPGRHRAKCRQFQHAALEKSGCAVAPRHRRPRHAVFVGRLLPWKRVALALQALALTPSRKLRSLCAWLGTDSGTAPALLAASLREGLARPEGSPGSGVEFRRQALALLEGAKR